MPQIIKKRLGAESNGPSADGLMKSPRAAADQIDAILFFLHKRYAGDTMLAETPSMRSFLVDKMEILFTNAVTHVQVEKKSERNMLTILTPPVAKEDEEPRRIYLLSEFGELLIRVQREGYLQVRDMLLAILNDEGKELLVKEYKKHKKERADRKKQVTNSK